MRGPDLTLAPPIDAAPLPEVRCHVPWPSQYYQMADVQDEVFHVIAIRITYDLTRLDQDGAPRLALQQAPLCMADEFPDNPAISSCVQESDLAPYKPLCDVLLAHATAYPPSGEPARRWPVSLRIGDWQKQLAVTGMRYIDRARDGWILTAPEPAIEVPLLWERAFGGTCIWPTHLGTGQQPELCTFFESNPVGVGWVDEEWYGHARVADVDAPRIELADQPFEQRHVDAMRYPPVGAGVVGKWWAPRRQKAGSYGDEWKETRWPRLPLDFEFSYWNAAPEDQQIEYPRGGEEVEFVGFVAGGGALRLRLPRRRPFLRIRLNAGPVLAQPMHMDTLVFDLKAMTLSCVHRMQVAARAGVRVLEICCEQGEHA